MHETARLPERIDSVEQLEDLLSEPTPAVIKTMARLDGDVLILGIGGKMGPTLARMAHRGSEVPKTAPRSPTPAADSSASHAACAATSPSEWPLHPSTPSQSRPASQHGRPASMGWTSTPIPVRMLRCSLTSPPPR